MMQNFFSVAEENGWAEKDWVVLGKGPTFNPNHAKEMDHSIALNHVVQVVEHIVITHAVDLEAVCDEVLDRSDYLLMPDVPHLRFRRCGMTLDHIATSFADKWPTIVRMNEEGRLLFYHRVLSLKPKGVLCVPVINFSSEGAIGCLAMCGVKTIYTSGIDGGGKYSEHFKNMIPLANGQKDFDSQLPCLEKVCARYGSRLEALP